MDWKIPGTVLEGDRQTIGRMGEPGYCLPPMDYFWMRQITDITGLEAYTVQNWVKRGFLAPPEGRVYTVDQLCRIILINMLKCVFPMERICRMLSYVNGKLDDTADDIIPDSKLYLMFIRLAARAKEMDKNPEAELDRELENYKEPYPGAAKRVRKVLKIMLTGYLSYRMKQEAEEKLDELLKGEPEYER